VRALELLELRNVSKIYFAGRGVEIPAVRNFNLTISDAEPEIVTIAGESGSGKTTVAKLALGIVEPTQGSVMYRGKDLRKLDKSERLRYRQEIQAVFQDPYAAFNPFHKVDRSLVLPLKKLGIAKSHDEVEKRIVNSLLRVGLNQRKY